MNKIHVKSGISGNDCSLDLQALHCFRVTANSQSFTHAAEHLCLGQSAVSHAMSRLERSIGLKLWEKAGHGVRLTEYGRELAIVCDKIFGELDGAVELMKNRKSQVLAGRFNIGTTVEFGNSILAEHLQAFLADHPVLDAGLTFSHNLIEPLLSGSLDVIIDCLVHAREDLWRIPLFREKYVLVAAPALLENTRIQHLEDMQRATWLSLDPEGNWWQRFLDVVPKRLQLNPLRFMPINHLRGMVRLAAAGAGIALIPLYCGLPEIQSGCLRILFPKLKMRQDWFSFYCRRSRKGSPKIKAFIGFLQALKINELSSTGSIFRQKSNNARTTENQGDESPICRAKSVNKNVCSGKSGRLIRKPVKNSRVER